MNNCCFLCNSQSSLSLRNATNLFGEHNTLKSGKKLHEVVSEILDKKLKENAVHSQIVCKKCYKSCSEYDFTQLSLLSMKVDLLNQFKTSIQSHNINYSTYEQDVTKNKPKNVAIPKIGKIVLPASKLRPLTPVELLKVGNRQHLLSDKLKASLPKLMINNLPKVEQVPEKQDALAKLTQFLKTETPDDIKQFLITKEGSKEIADNDGNDDDDAMEIDEDFAVSVVPSSDGNLVFEVKGFKNMSPASPKTEQYLDVDLLETINSTDPEMDKNIIVEKVEIMGENEDEESETIVLNGDNTSILRMMSGQKFIYEGNEISLMVPTDVQNDGENDGQDSNDESQIELQVSGDEETANAIIAAAQEKGGAFIKVESGEMYRVQSVQSKCGDDLSNMISYDNDLFSCLLCKNSDKPESEKMQSTTDANSIIYHMRTIHDARIYICRLCNHMFRKRMDYTNHIAEHSQKIKPRPPTRGVHNCDRCGKTFASKYTLQAHYKIHSNRPRPFKCNQCAKSFFTQQNLNQHEKTHSNIKEFACNVCGKSFSTQHNLEVHGIVHSREKPFVCGVCDKAFARRAEVRDHMRTHTGERPFSCDTCSASFSQRSNLDSHKRATHLNERRYHCTQCPKRFKRRRLLEYHIKASHTGERPLKCEVCEASFVYPEHFKKHMRIHSGERPYFCEICGKTFTTRDNRNTHRFTHSDKKPYECLSCGAGFMRKQLLYAHMTSNGHLAESIVVNQPRVTKVHTSNMTTQILDVQTFEAKKFETLFESDELHLDENSKQEVKAISLMQNSEEPLLIQTLEADNATNILETVNSQQIQQAQIIGNDENGDVVRLIQVKLPDGNDGWVAVND